MAERIGRSLFEELVREHHGAVYRAAVRVLADEDAALDATQEVFLILLRDGLPEGARDLGAVLRHRAMQRALARQGSERRRRRREERVAVERDEAFEEGIVEREESRRRVARVLAGLPGELRAAVALRFGEGLTFAAMAELLGCSEPTAHDRVRRGLERMKGELARAGLAGLAPGLPGLLETLEPPPVPSGLETTLLGLTAAVKPAAALTFTASSAITAVGLGLAIVAAAVLAPRWLGRPGGAEAARNASIAATSERASADAAGPWPTESALEAGRSRELVARVAPANAERPTGIAGVLDPARVRGWVSDDHGAPLAGALIELLGERPGLKTGLAEVAEHSGLDGAFELALEPGDYPYRVRVRAPGRLEHRTAALRIERGALLVLGELLLLPDGADEPGEFSLAVLLLDESDLPVGDALVVLERRALERGGMRAGDAASPAPEPRWTWTREDSGRTDAQGRIELCGARLGTKRARVVPWRPEPFASPAPGEREVAPATFALDVDRPGVHERVLRLAAALAIEGRIRRADGAPLSGELTHAVVAIPGGDEGWAHGRLEPDGRFRIGGLADRPHELRVSLAGLSPVTRAGVVPGGAPLEFTLKGVEDPRPIGDHDGELHGRALDARSGELLELGPYDAFAEPLFGEELGMDVARLLAQRRDHPRSYQVALGPDSVRESRASFSVVGLAPGTYALWISAPGHATGLAGIFELGPGELRAGIEARLEPR